MLSYYLKYRKYTESKNKKVVETKNGRTMVLLKCAVCNRKKSRTFKEQEARGLLSKLTGIKVSILRDLPIANILF